MASEESRRVADYFVVCGLPKNNPQLLDDSSLEVSLRSTAHQDPITDIAVSNRCWHSSNADYIMR